MDADTLATTQDNAKDHDNEGASDNAQPSDEIPHARGPAILGVENLGLQDGRGVEITLETGENNTDANQISSGNDSSMEVDISHSIGTDADGDVVADQQLSTELAQDQDMSSSLAEKQQPAEPMTTAG